MEQELQQNQAKVSVELYTKMWVAICTAVTFLRGYTSANFQIYTVSAHHVCVSGPKAGVRHHATAAGQL